MLKSALKNFTTKRNIFFVKLTAFSLIFGLIMSMNVFFARCDSIRPSILRLHVLANSDSAGDQLLKLKVRDAVLEKSALIFSSADSIEEAKRQVVKHGDTLTAAAKEVIAQNGYDYPVTVSLEECYFENRVYDNVTLPAGVYEAVRVVIGSGGGKNWWCVMFPSLCLPAATGKADSVDDVLSKEQTDIVTGGSKYRVKFKVVEFFEELCQKFSDRPL